jgi:hypothetical protein
LIKTLGGGVYDAAGAGQLRPQLPFDLIYDCKAVGATPAALRSALDGLRALRGVRGRLYRRGLDDSIPNFPQWAMARLEEVVYTTEARHSHGLFQPLSLKFSVTTLWHGVLHGAPWYLDSGEYLDTGLYLDMYDRYPLTTTSETLSITNGGNIYTDDVVLTLEAGSSVVTSLSVSVGSCEIVYTGTVDAGTSLVIDCSPTLPTVTNDGVAAWSGFSLGASHASEAWLRLEPGANSVLVERTGGGADTYLTIEFSDRWQ